MAHRIRRFASIAAAVALAGVATAAHAVVEIQWWHAMTGANNDRGSSAVTGASIDGMAPDSSAAPVSADNTLLLTDIM